MIILETVKEDILKHQGTMQMIKECLWPKQNQNRTNTAFAKTTRAGFLHKFGTKQTSGQANKRKRIQTRPCKKVWKSARRYFGDSWTFGAWTRPRPRKWFVG